MNNGGSLSSIIAFFDGANSSGDIYGLRFAWQ
jgi:hypothetical protein